MPEKNGGVVWCWVKKRLFAAGAIAGAIVVLIGAASALDQYRWWVWRDSEFAVVASRVYEVTIPEQRRVVSSIERDLERAKSVPPARRDIRDNQIINKLESDLEDERDQLRKLYKERDRFAPQ